MLLKKYVLYLLIFFAGFYFLFFVGISPSFSDSKPSDPIVKNDIKKYYKDLEHPWLIEPIREKTLEPLRVAKSIGVKQGMTIVDIGAGYGMFTFAFADVLKGTGKVFATDVSLEKIKFLKDKAKKEKYKNVFPVFVEFKGVDDFYKQHNFDIIFLWEIFETLNPEEYFREIRVSLNKENGRIILGFFKEDSDLTKLEFGEFKAVMAILSAEGEDFPIFKKLSIKCQDFVRKWKKGDAVPEVIQDAIVKDFNAMLLDRLLYPELQDYYQKLNWEKGLTVIYLHPSDRPLAKWLVFLLESNKVFDKQKKDISEVDKRNLHRLNRKILVDVFTGYRIEREDVLYNKDLIISTMEKAGYTFMGEHNILTYYYILEFKRKY